MTPEVFAYSLRMAELIHVASVGCLRQIESTMNKRLLRPWAAGAFDGHIFGAAGEYVASLYLEQPWNLNVGLFGEPDVGKLTHVRTSSKRYGAETMMIRERDKPKAGHFWVHAVTNLPDHPIVSLTGWLPDERVRDPRYWKDPNGNGFAWWVPQEDLWPISQLKEKLRELSR